MRSSSEPLPSRCNCNKFTNCAVRENVMMPHMRLIKRFCVRGGGLEHEVGGNQGRGGVDADGEVGHTIAIRIALDEIARGGRFDP